MNKLFYTILGSVSLIFLIVCVNLNSRINDLNTKVSDLEWTVQEHELSIQRLTEKNTMQDVMINKLNNDYNSRMAQQLQEIADMNGVGG